MIFPGKLDLPTQRWTPFIYVMEFPGFDFSGGVFAADVRLRRDAPGDPLIALRNAVSSAEGISCTVTTEGGAPTSYVQIRINETTIEGILLNAAGAGKDIILAWDLHITGGGYEKTRWLEGKFIIKAGVTQNG